MDAACGSGCHLWVWPPTFMSLRKSPLCYFEDRHLERHQNGDLHPCCARWRGGHAGSHPEAGGPHAGGPGAAPPPPPAAAEFRPHRMARMPCWRRALRSTAPGAGAPCRSCIRGAYYEVRHMGMRLQLEPGSPCNWRRKRTATEWWSLNLRGSEMRRHRMCGLGTRF